MRWTDEVLDAVREAGDPPVDAVVAELFSTDSIDGVNGLTPTLLRNDGLPPEALPAVVREYLDRTDDLPAWADLERICTGEEFFGGNGPAVVMAFAFASLPICSTARKGVQVLALTARLQTEPVRRNAETAQPVLSVMAAGGLGPGGRGVRDAQTVRLMHAAVRHPERGPDWSLPVNQEGMGGTRLTFSFTVLEALDKLGVSISEEEADACLHAWNAVGQVMGIEPGLTAAMMDDARELTETIWDRRWEACPDGRPMTAALVGAMEHFAPGSAFDGMPGYLIRYLCGDELVDILAVDHPGWTSLLGGPLKLLVAGSDLVADHTFLVGKVSGIFSRNLLEGFGCLTRGGNRARFDIPEHLATRWNVRRPADVL